MKQAALRTLVSHSKTFSTIRNRDFFGITHITTKDIAGASFGMLDEQHFTRKYEPLIVSRYKLENEPVEVDLTFGQMRYDNDNIPKTHGQFEQGNEKRKFETVDVKQAFVTSDQEGELKEEKQKHLSQQEETLPSQEEILRNFVPQHEGENPPYYIAQIEPTLDINEAFKLFKTDDSNEQKLEKQLNKAPLTFYFRFERDEILSREDHLEQAHTTTEQTRQQLGGRHLDEAEIEKTIQEADMMTTKKPPLIFDMSKEAVNIEDQVEEEISEDALNNRLTFDKSLDEKFDVKRQLQRGPKALEYLRDVRSRRVEPTAKGLKHRLENENPYPMQSQIKLDSMGFRIYTNQVPDWSACRRVEILNYLERAITYNNYDILAVNKPYGIASHSEELNAKDRFDMNTLIQELANSRLNIEEVYLAHRLDKTTTGVLLFATSQERAKNLAKLFKSDQIKKTYWCITRGVPDPKVGIIDIPIGSFSVAGKVRSCLAPEDLEEMRHLTKRHRLARRAITEYKVVKDAKYCALVEVKPRSGVKHQIRCHLAFGLNKPILGDHKYSNIGKIAPQVLPVQMLNKLHIRQTKVRTLPIHLHAKSIVIPGAKANGETLFINAPLPPHFVENLKSLKLTVQHEE